MNNKSNYPVQLDHITEIITVINREQSLNHITINERDISETIKDNAMISAPGPDEINVFLLLFFTAKKLC